MIFNKQQQTHKKYKLQNQCIIQKSKIKVMLSPIPQRISRQYSINISGCLHISKRCKVYKAIQKKTSEHYVIKILNIQKPEFRNIIQKNLCQTKYLLQGNMDFQFYTSNQQYQYGQSCRLQHLCLVRPFINGPSLYDIFMKSQRNPFQIGDFPYYANKYYQTICKTFSKNFFPNLQNIYLKDYKLIQNYASFQDILFLKKHYPLSKSQFSKIYCYLQSDLFTSDKSEAEQITNNFIQSNLKLRSLFIFILSFMTGKIPNLIEDQQLPRYINLQSIEGKRQVQQLFKQNQISKRWNKYLNKKQIKVILQMYGTLFKANKEYYVSYFHKILVKQQKQSHSYFQNNGFFNFNNLKVNAQKNRSRYNLKQFKDQSQFELIKIKIQNFLNKLQQFMKKDQHLKFGCCYFQQSSKRYIIKQLSLNQELINEFSNWYQILLVSSQSQTEEIKCIKQKIKIKIDEYLIKTCIQEKIPSFYQNANQKHKKTNVSSLQKKLIQDLMFVRFQLLENDNQINQKSKQIKIKKQKAKSKFRKHLNLVIIDQDMTQEQCCKINQSTKSSINQSTNQSIYQNKN